MIPAQSDLIGNESHSPLAASPLCFVEIEASIRDAGPAPVRVAVDRQGCVPDLDPVDFDVLMTTATTAPAPWVSVDAARLDKQMQSMSAVARSAPMATSMLAKVLRLQEGLDFDSALEVESLAYSTLLGGSEFAKWTQGKPKPNRGKQAVEPVRYDRMGDTVTLTLQSAGNRNAMTAAMRDALFECLVNVLEDPSFPALALQAEGRCFSTGGDLAELGTARDLAQAHVIRTLRSCTRLLHRLGERATVYLHGACIGSGIEVPAATGCRIGKKSAFFQLPELRMGLIPGAGGTVSIGRAIGRHRLMWLCLGAFRIGSPVALDWGLLHRIEP